jgi:carbamoyltransferase
MSLPKVLGISAFYHDAAAALVDGGRIVAAAQEERFTRRKNDPAFPRAAINYCLGEAFIEPDELQAVAFYDNPVMTFDRVVGNFLAVAPDGGRQWGQALRSFLGTKAAVRQHVDGALGGTAKLLFVDHHLSHAASAFYPSPFEAAAILVVDGVGEWSTASIGVGSGSQIEMLREIRYPHSIGLLYSAFTGYCGFKVNSGEYKLMGLAPYGEPRYAAAIRDHLIDLREDGSFRLNLDYFAFMTDGVMTNERFHELFGGPPRAPESRIEIRHMDLAASVQRVTEEAMCHLAREARRLADTPSLVMAGGVALNCVANGKILRDGQFDRIWVQPAAGDAGGALGAALYAAHRYFEVPRSLPAGGRDAQQGSLLGPSFSAEEVRSFLDSKRYPYRELADRRERARIVAQAIADGRIVGLFFGRMEFGPRALGARSILGDPRRDDVQSLMNLKIKFRESFRPFAPAVLAERAAEYFDLGSESPYMLLVAPVRGERCWDAIDWPAFRAGDGDMIKLVNARRSDIPAVTHVDMSARVQTVTVDDSPELHAILGAFAEATGCPVLVNTSFNVRGEPIVCTPQDAYRCFMRTDIDLLVLQDCILEKQAQPKWTEDGNWREKLQLD